MISSSPLESDSCGEGMWIMPRRFEPLADDRQSIRLSGYDYARAGTYFVTICVAGRKQILGQIRNGAAVLSEAGHLVLDAWEQLPLHYPHVRLDEFVVMPNHVHGIVMLDGGGGTGTGRSGASGDRREAGQAGAGRTIPTSRDTPPAHGTPTPARHHPLPEIVRAFKSFSARAINIRRGTPGTPVWQRNYYECILRDARALSRVRRYIRENPAKWGGDRFH